MKADELKQGFALAREVFERLKQDAKLLPKDPEIEAASAPIHKDLLRLGAGRKGLEPEKTGKQIKEAKAKPNALPNAAPTITIAAELDKTTVPKP